ncbi:XRE family transcriptional regulator, partial [Streptomyces sp. TRM76130]|nr:XRE family transcriptional regulator [Streptomyces sp. TRM76130]
LDKPEDVTQYGKAMEELQRDSPGPEESRDILRGLLQLS